MKKIIKINDIDYGYMYDEITCFEHPIIIVMDYFHKGYGRLVATLLKLNEAYITKFHQKNCSMRDNAIMKIENTFDVEIRNDGKINYSQIRQYIEEDRLLIAGINLKDLFYSNYYKKDNWCHWLLINGYDDATKNIHIFDNVQFNSIEHEYGDFVLPYKELKKVNKAFIKRYGKEQSLMEFKLKKIRNKRSILIDILKEYVGINLDDEKSYRQESINHELITLSKNMDIFPFEREHQKKLININKYKRIFFRELAIKMEETKYSSEYEEEYLKYLKLNKEIIEFWEKRTFIYIKEMMKGQMPEKILTNEIILKEKDIQNEVKKFLIYLENTEVIDEIHMRSNIKDAQNFTIENDNGYINLTSGNRGDYDLEFNFYDGKILNWWDMDDSPKLIIDKNQFTYIELSNVENIVNGNAQLKSEIGIFIRNREKEETILLGLEMCAGKKELIYSFLGKSGCNVPISWNDSSKIICEYGRDEIKLSIFNDGITQIIHTEKNNGDDFDIGITCKTWGEKGIRKIRSMLKI